MESSITLTSILNRYYDRFVQRYGCSLTTDQWSALNAQMGCRQGQYGELLLNCQHCHQSGRLPRSCGHRSCNQCQYQSTQQWLERQCQKQLPVAYYMATFTLPYELRAVAKAQPKAVYAALMHSATLTLKRFGLNKKGFNAELGLCAVLHTHTRRLDYHPHVHIVVPGGGIHRRQKQWRKLTGDYLFNGRALAQAFRGEFLHQLSRAAIPLPSTPKRWVVQCQKVGRGKEALQYLSRYLYRGVISDKNILDDSGTEITFRYKDSKTQAENTRTLPGEEFIALLLQHVLPKGFRRARDYGFLHGNAKALLRIVQWVLNVERPPPTQKSPFAVKCSRCLGTMRVIGISLARASPK